MLRILQHLCLQFKLNIFVHHTLPLMKIFFSLVLFQIIYAASYSQGYKITLQAADYKSGLAYLTYYYGKNLNVQDSSIINPKGIAIYQGNKKLIPGVYSIVFPGKRKYFGKKRDFKKTN